MLRICNSAHAAWLAFLVRLLFCSRDCIAAAHFINVHLSPVTEVSIRSTGSKLKRAWSWNLIAWWDCWLLSCIGDSSTYSWMVNFPLSFDIVAWTEYMASFCACLKVFSWLLLGDWHRKPRPGLPWLIPGNWHVGIDIGKCSVIIIGAVKLKADLLGIGQ